MLSSTLYVQHLFGSTWAYATERRTVIEKIGKGKSPGSQENSSFPDKVGARANSTTYNLTLFWPSEDLLSQISATLPCPAYNFVVLFLCRLVCRSEFRSVTVKSSVILPISLLNL